jgi:predicted Zn-dependent protease
MTALVDPAWFAALAERVCGSASATGGGSTLRVSLYLAAEDSTFIRFNHAAVRQATRVAQGDLTLSVSRTGEHGVRRIEITRTLSGNLELDASTLSADRERLVIDLEAVADDPFLLLSDTVAVTHRHDHGLLPDTATLVASVARLSAAHGGLDWVGHCASGPVVRAYADSRGQRHWHHVETFHFEWCLVATADKSVKTVYAGTHWDDSEFERQVAEGAAQLPLLSRPAMKLAPGAYRTYFAPAAMSGLLGVTAWGGFGAKARHTGTSSLMKLARGEARLHAGLTLSEDASRGAAPAFTPEGDARPACTVLIDSGQARDTLNSPRSAREYGLVSTGADEGEYPVALHLAPGTLPRTDALAALGTGLFVSDLWYLNYSDRAECRVTGMTRFACFWVEDGRVVAPLEVMRFDDSILRMFGEGLIALTNESELILAGRVMRERPLASLRTPGALVEGWRLTL